MAFPRPARILVVEDNEVLRTLLAQVIEAAGFEVIPADAAEPALDVARSDPPDLCLVDHVMPGMSGAELIRALRTDGDERLRTVPVIGISASEAPELLDAGAAFALRKPVAERELLDGIRRALGAGPRLAQTA